MKNYISSKTMIAGVALGVLVSAGIYITHDNSITLPDNEQTALPPSTAEDINNTTTTPIPVVKIADWNASIETREQVNTRAKQEEDFASLEKSNRVQLTEAELALPAPSGENVITEATGEYADQINPQGILQTARQEGYFPPEVDPDSHPPGSNNITSERQDKYAHEVNQQALINKARLEGYSLPDVSPDSHPPTGENVTSKLQGEKSPESIELKSM
ncbi:MAG: hypothetical protein HYZ31_00280 [Gammaproteobacteria bacterium]|nr:hypothetical protein [Gammaproteobacteria bacterium]